MSTSSAELLRQVKSEIEEVDPAEVLELLDEGVAIIDVREAEELALGALPRSKHVPRSYLESRIEGLVPDKATPVILYCASGIRSAYAARTLTQELGYQSARSLRGGITLWKDRGYDVVLPKVFTPEQSQRYSRHVLIPEIGLEGQH
ncbi:MAG: rhodanese-like domain-containing protein, partial [Solirubrobacteraceae bacterium]